MDFKTLKATLKKNIVVRLRAYQMEFFLGSVLTSFYTALGAWLAYNVLFKNNLSEDFITYSGTGNYMSYIIIGGLAFLFTVRTCLNVSRSLISELREGTLESLMLAPFRRAEYFAGNMLVQTVTTLFETFVATLVALPFGFRLGHTNFAAFICVFLLSLLAFFAVSMLLGFVMLYTRDTYISQNTLFASMALLCGITFPVEYLPVGLQVVSKLIPVTDVVKMYRGTLLSGAALSDITEGMIWVAALSSVYIVIGMGLMKKAEIAALEKIGG